MKIVAYLLLMANFMLLINPFLFSFKSKAGVDMGLDHSLLRHRQLELLNVRGDLGGVRCYLVGAFQSDMFVGLISSLDEEGVAVRVHVHSYARAPRYMVFIPPFDSQEVAVRRSKELSQIGVDNYVVVGGEFDNTISVGVFENIDSAKRHSVRLADVVPSVLVRELPRNGVEYWASIKVASVISGGEVRRMLTESGVNEDLLEISCKSVDS